MSNLLKMHLFRARKYKLTWVLPGILILLIAIMFGAMWLESELFSSFEAESFAEVSVGEVDLVSSAYSPTSSSYFDTVLLMLQTGFIPMLLIMYVLLFFAIDRSTGFIKNIVGYMDNKSSVAGANLLFSAIYLTVLVAVTMLVSLPASYLIFDQVTYDGIGGFLKYLAVFYLSALSFTMILIWLADKTGKHPIMMILGIIVLAFGSLLYMLINYLVEYLRDGGDFMIQKYLPIGGLQTLALDSPALDFMRIGGISLAILVGAFFLDVVALKKQDIK